VKKAALVVLTRKGKVSRKVRQPLKLTTPPFFIDSPKKTDHQKKACYESQFSTVNMFW